MNYEVVEQDGHLLLNDGYEYNLLAENTPIGYRVKQAIYLDILLKVVYDTIDSEDAFGEHAVETDEWVIYVDGLFFKPKMIAFNPASIEEFLSMLRLDIKGVSSVVEKAKASMQSRKTVFTLGKK